MCGRMGHNEAPTWASLYRYYDIVRPANDILDGYGQGGDIAPTDKAVIVAERYGERRVTIARWWLVPRNATKLDQKRHMYNARSDKLRYHYNKLTKEQRGYFHPYIQPLLQGRKCLIPMSHYYEFKDGRPYKFSLKGRPLFSVAGIWDWNPHIITPEWPQGVLSCTMVTTEPNEVAEPIHDRMPVILNPNQYDRWLQQKTYIPDALDMLEPYEGDDLEIEACRLPSDDQIELFTV